MTRWVGAILGAMTTLGDVGAPEVVAMGWDEGDGDASTVGFSDASTDGDGLAIADGLLLPVTDGEEEMFTDGLDEGALDSRVLGDDERVRLGDIEAAVGGSDEDDGVGSSHPMTSTSTKLSMFVPASWIST